LPGIARKTIGVCCFTCTLRVKNGARESDLFVCNEYDALCICWSLLMKGMQFQLHGTICSILIDDYEASCRCRITVDCFTRSQLPALSTIRSNDFANEYTCDSMCSLPIKETRRKLSVCSTREPKLLNSFEKAASLHFLLSLYRASFPPSDINPCVQFAFCSAIII
jgi:hypothetical protein